MQKISIVIPCYKSQNTISDVVDKIELVLKESLSEYKYEIILVNDCSPDGTYSVIKEVSKRNDKIIAIDLARNFGQHSAIMAGLNKATGDIILCMDDDGQTDSNEIPKLIMALDDDYDVIYGKYVIKKHSFLRNLGSKINDIMMRSMLEKPKKLYISSYFVMKKYIRDELVKYKKPYPYLGGMILRNTNKIKNVEINHNERINGESGYTLKKLIKLWVNGFTNFSVKPLRLAMFFSVIVAIVSFLIIIYLIVNKMINPAVPMGWTSSIMASLLSCSVISFFLGIIGEYIGRIYISINKVPQYVIRECAENGRNSINDSQEGEE